MRTVVISSLVALFVGLAHAGIAHAQSAPPPTPTTKILAIGTMNPGVDLAKALAILPTEARETLKLYLDGKIDQWYSLEERRGVAFVLNMTDKAAAREMLEKLPLGQAHLMTFELIPIGPIGPLRQLLAQAPSAH